MAKKQTTIYTVSQVNTLIQVALEDKLPPRLTIHGQISDWKSHHSGHRYFLLIEQNAVLPCVMWSSKFKNVKFEPENGIAVQATGHIDVYPPQGKYQFYVDRLAPAGVGALQLAFEQMVNRLESEGLFADEHKKEIPPWPMKIAIITSESGAALMDIADSIYNRWPCVKLLLYPTPVQGPQAARQIADAIRHINSRNRDLQIDVLIAGRGGGSLEDLWAFNEEVLARAIFDSKIPIISAVGHEIDTTIADLVADARASTPTKAGMIAVPERAEVLDKLKQAKRRLGLSLQTRLEYSSPILHAAAANLSQSAGAFLMKLRERLGRTVEAVLRIEPGKFLSQKQVELNYYSNMAQTNINNVLTKKQLQLTAMENRLKGLNPRKVLERGYSITANKNTGKLVRKAGDVKVGYLLVTELAQKNLIESIVKSKLKSQE